MKRKQGISLIVLVITIIVMIVLAAAVVITLSNTGIINKANEAVEKTNKKQIEQLATLAWSEAFMDGARTEAEFKNAVNEALKDVDTSGYEIIVTDKGVTVTEGDGTPTTPDEGGLYDASGNLIASWQTLVDKHGLDVTKDYDTSENFTEETSHIYNIISNNAEYVNTYEVKVSNKVKRIGNMAMALGNIASIKKVTLLDGIEVIGKQGLGGGTNVVTVVLPSTLKSIEEQAFILSSVTSIHIPASVESLASGFAVWSKTTSLTVDANNPYYKAVNNVIYTKDGKQLVQSAMEIKEALVIPDGVEVIREVSLAFSNYTSLSIPASVTTIEKNAFEEMVDLTSITFAEGSKLTSIGNAAFLCCSSLTNINIPEGVTEIKANTFKGVGIVNMTLPSTITSIEAGSMRIDFYTTLTMKATIPPTLPSGNAISESEPDDLQIIVPKGTGDAYKAATGWSDYAAFITEATE